MLKGRVSLTPTGAQSNLSFTAKHAVLQRGLNLKAQQSLIDFAGLISEG